MSARKTECKPGYDGAEFVVERIRDLAGRGKRDIVRRLRYDVIGQLAKRGRLTEIQRAAATQIQCDWQMGEMMITARSAIGTRGRNDDFGLLAAKIDAQKRYGDAVRIWDVRYRSFVVAIVIQNRGIGATCKRFEIPDWLGHNILSKCLDDLARYYERVLHI